MQDKINFYIVDKKQSNYEKSVDKLPSEFNLSPSKNVSREQTPLPEPKPEFMQIEESKEPAKPKYDTIVS